MLVYDGSCAMQNRREIRCDETDLLATLAHLNEVIEEFREARDGVNIIELNQLPKNGGARFDWRTAIIRVDINADAARKFMNAAHDHANHAFNLARTDEPWDARTDLERREVERANDEDDRSISEFNGDIITGRILAPGDDGLS